MPCRPTLPLALLAIGAATLSPALAIPPPPLHPDETSYLIALGQVENYQTCGGRGHRRAAEALVAELHAIESLARAEGLEPVLERQREARNRRLAVSSMMMIRCAGGPASALAAARRALDVFRAWVEQAPPRTSPNQ